MRVLFIQYITHPYIYFSFKKKINSYLSYERKIIENYTFFLNYTYKTLIKHYIYISNYFNCRLKKKPTLTVDKKTIFIQIILNY